MAFTYKMRRQMAEECFAIDDFIYGTLSGGIETPRRITSIDVKGRVPKTTVSICYTYGSNPYYTDLRTGKDYKTIYHIDCRGKISKEGSDKLFDIDKKDPFYDLCEREITAFYEKWAAVRK